MNSHTRDGSADTPHGQRYIKMFSGHWARKFDIQPQDEGTRIVFPKEDDDPDYPEEAIATLRSTESRLDVQLTAVTQTMLDAYWDAIDSHLDRFATREGGLRLVIRA